MDGIGKGSYVFVYYLLEDDGRNIMDREISLIGMGWVLQRTTLGGRT